LGLLLFNFFINIQGTSEMENDKLFLCRAIEIATNGILIGGGPFGAVIVRDNKIISEAFNRVILNNDPTAHAEILAIRLASSVLQSRDLQECTLYTSCEPCPMCLGAIYWCGITRIFYSCDRTDAERAGFSDKLIYNEIMLDPSKRKISFIRLTDSGGKEVFRKWDELENKVTY
jgi:tRNA(Arg) A34 adenosine deaminase TadA